MKRKENDDIEGCFYSGFVTQNVIPLCNKFDKYCVASRVEDTAQKPFINGVLTVLTLIIYTV